ncbi:NAD(P)-dependent oxidoreductase [Chryseobacterium daecheongense]|uniref:NAD-dependent epimerase/dehydratase family protein n=1 Tax=Chryseobacterium daecheongense TaxID=192389 RepID=A0A3N0W3L1_9FLAO|nr:NAD(P)H-binding protein [Chryseobacterium daecheongense]ROH99649.1 NAD-dependent epimerase/dehydratase family protein [Chryseobacterium daecheongense]TDX95437.1 putative NADH-flavin reductase [Chryseobacterium daecheongense]
MKKHLVAVIGGTGKSGQYLVQHLVRKGYPMKLLVRNPEHFTPGNSLIKIVKGDARDYNAVDALIKDCTVVISTLGQPKGEKSIFSDATGNMIKAMHSNGIKRYIVTTGLSVSTPFDMKNKTVKAATEWMYEYYPETTLDKQKEYELLTKSNLDWTLVRLPLILQTLETFPTEANLNDCKGENISATDLAEFLVSEIEDEHFLGKSPFLYNKK